MRESQKQSLLSRRGIALAALILLLLAASPDPARAQGSVEQSLRKDLTGANVILIVFNSLSARHLGAYGYERETSPNFDALAAESVLFERCYSQTASDFSSYASLLTGLDPLTTRLFGVYRIGMELAPEYYTFAEMMRDAGYLTARFISSMEASSAVALDQGFVIQNEFFRDKSMGPAAADRFLLDWFYKARGERFFAFLQIETPEAPYNPPPPYRGLFTRDATAFPERLSRLLTSEVTGMPLTPAYLQGLTDAYDENVAYADYRLGLYVDRLRELGLLEKTLLIVTSNHGEAFGEHDRIRHDTTVYEPMIHVPLLVRLPGSAAPRGQRVGEVVELIDVMPSVADAIDFALIPARGHKRFRVGHQYVGEGQSWLPVVWGGASTNDHVAYAMCMIGARAVIEKRWKLIRDEGAGQEALFDLEADPGETRNLVKVHPEEAERLRKLWMDVFRRQVVPVKPVEFKESGQTGTKRPSGTARRAR